MLTRELLVFRVRDGKLRPTFVKTAERELLALATELIAEVEAAKRPQPPQSRDL